MTTINVTGFTQKQIDAALAAAKQATQDVRVVNNGKVLYTNTKSKTTQSKTTTQPEQDAGTISQKELDAIIGRANLTPDQRAFLGSYADVLTTLDIKKAERLVAAMKASTEFSSPYFKAQVKLATDALERGLSGKEGDLKFQEEQQRRTLEELKQNTAASKDFLSFKHQQELAQLQRKYEQDLQTTQESLAATGFTSSSRRSRAEQLLSEENQGLVESSKKQFGYQVGNLDRTLGFQSQDTAAQIENYRRLASEGKLDLLRSAEERVGTGTLKDLGYGDLIGKVGGTIPRQQATDAFQFASNFIF